MYRIIVNDHFPAMHVHMMGDAAWQKRHGHVWHVAVHFLCPNITSEGITVPHDDITVLVRKVLMRLEDHELGRIFRTEGANPAVTDETIGHYLYEAIQESLRREVGSSSALDRSLALEKVVVWHNERVKAEFFRGMVNITSQLA